MPVNIGPKIGIDGEAKFRKELGDIIQQAKTLASEMKVVTSSFDANDQSQKKLSAQASVLNKQIELQKTRIEQLRQAVTESSSKFGEADYNTQRWKQAVADATSELNRMKQQLGALDDAMESGSSATDRLTKTIESQKREIEDLKHQYSDAVLEYGKTSSEAEDLRKKINSLSRELKNNEKSFDDAQFGVKGFKDGLDDAGKSGLTFGDIVKGNIISDAIISGVKELASAFVELGKQSIQNAADIKAEASQFEQTFGDMGDEASAAIKRVADSSGILETRLKSTGTQMYAFARSTGGDAATSMDIMERALQVAADSAAYYDHSLEETTESLQSFLKGNYENDAALGLSATETTRNAAAMDLFGKEFNDLSEIQKQETLLKMVEDSQKLSGAMGQASREADGWENVMGNLQEAWRQFTGNLGSTFLPAVTDAVKQMSGLLSGELSFESFIEGIVSQAPDVAAALVEMLTGAIDGLRDSLDVVIPAAFDLVQTLIQSMIDAVPSVVSLLSEFVIQLADGISENADEIANSAVDLVEELATGIVSNLPYIALAIVKAMYSVRFAIIKAIPDLIMAALNVVGEYLSTAADFIWPYLEPALQSIGGFFSEWGTQIGEWWNNLWASFGQWLGDAWQNIYNTVIGWWNNVVSFFTETIPAWIASIGEWFQQLPYNIGYALGQAIGSVIKFGQDAWNWVTTELPKIITGIIEWFQQLPGRIWKWLLDTIDRIKQWGSQTYTSMTTAAKNAFNGVVDWFKQLPGRIWSWLTSVIDKVKSWGSNLVKTGTDAAKNTFNNIIDWFKKLPGKILDIGKSIVEGLWNGITSMGDWLWGNVTGFFGGLVDGIKNTLGIHSPSRVMRDEVGKMLPAGAVLGVRDAMPKAIRQVDGMFSGLVSAMSPVSARVSPAGASGGINYGGISIVVNAAPGMDENALVRRMEQRLAEATRRKEAVWG